MESQGKGKVALTFGLYVGDTLVRRETVVQDIVKVGKDPRSHLRVDDDLASRMHAVIEVASPSDITLIDLGNEPGTLVNGQRVNKCKVRPGDQVQIGGTVLVLEDAVAATSVAPPPPPSAPPTMSAPGSYGAPPAPPPMGQAMAPSPGLGDFGPGAGVGAFGAFAAPPAPSPMGGRLDPMMGGPSAFQGAGAFNGASLLTDGAQGPYTYTLIKSGPDVSPDEVEVAHLASVEVMVLWDTNVLHVAHLTPPRSYYVGDESEGEKKCDFFVPSDTVGGKRVPIVTSQGAGAAVVILPRASGYVEIPGQGRIGLDELVRGGRARPSSEVSGAHEFELPPGAKARVECPDSAIVFQVTATNAGKPVPVGFFSTFESAAYVFTALSFLLHLGVIASLAFFMPSMRGDDSEAIDRDQMLEMMKLLNAAAEREQEQRETEQAADVNADNKEGGTGQRAKGEEGSMGNPNTKDTGKRFGVKGPQDNPDPHVARQAALREAAEFGMIGLINVGGAGDPNAPTSPFGRDDSLGNDPMSARGNMFGDAIGDAFGAGGLGLSGVGEGGGGRGEGIGLGNIGTIGHGAGTGSGQGFGSGHGRLGGSHQTKSPAIRQGATQVNGRLPPEVIQRIVRANFGRFKLCYENGLRTNPNLQGRVSVKFVIDRSGSVSLASDGGSDLPDQGVVACVVRGFGNLSFPQPEGGIVTVVYPLNLTPGD